MTLISLAIAVAAQQPANGPAVARHGALFH